jgi:Zn-dependent peptidase ImmA (M78 family)
VWAPLLPAEPINESIIARASAQNPQGAKKLQELEEIPSLHASVVGIAEATVRETLKVNRRQRRLATLLSDPTCHTPETYWNLALEPIMSAWTAEPSMPRTEVPISPEVLRWALDESGYSDDQIAEAVGVGTDDLQMWTTGRAKPGLTQLKRLATKLHRQRAVFLLPEPPQTPPVQVQFRSISGESARPLSPKERQYLRRAHRQQEMLGWLSEELGDLPRLPSFTVSDNAESAGNEVRSLLTIEIDEQLRWPSAAQAFDHWRASVERLGANVFLYALGKDSCNGFSLWHELSPLIAVSSAWREEARIFTLFHELGHLVTRSDSACIERRVNARPRDPVERWCELFAASVLLPRAAVERFLGSSAMRTRVADLGIVSGLATRARISLRAATIRLIELGLAGWDLYDQIPPLADKKPEGGGGTGRNRLAIREDEFGARGTRLFVEGVKKEVISRSQAVSYLDIPDEAFDHLAAVSPE